MQISRNTCDSPSLGQPPRDPYALPARPVCGSSGLMEHFCPQGHLLLVGCALHTHEREAASETVLYINLNYYDINVNKILHPRSTKQPESNIKILWH